jgi:pyruvate dehydrogenase E1 component alpha subunit
LAQRAEAYDMAWDVFQGEDIYEVRARTWQAIERAHQRSEPSVLEIRTYRYYGHSVADANAKKYRTPEEIERYKAQHDPIQLLRRRLEEEGVITEADYEEIDQQSKAEANKAVEFAEQSPFPTTEDIQKDVYYEVDHQTEAAKHGTYFFNS